LLLSANFCVIWGRKLLDALTGDSGQDLPLQDVCVFKSKPHRGDLLVEKGINQINKKSRRDDLDELLVEFTAKPLKIEIEK
jgi:hypothetical protein